VSGGTIVLKPRYLAHQMPYFATVAEKRFAEYLHSGLYRTRIDKCTRLFPFGLPKRKSLQETFLQPTGIEAWNAVCD
jgi:hypothetical protein